MKNQCIISLLAVIAISCSRAPLTKIQDSMRLISHPLVIEDSLSKDSFFKALTKNIELLKSSNRVQDPIIFGSIKVSKASYIEFLEKIQQQEKNSDWCNWLTLNSQWLEVYGASEWGEVLSTGYYEPEVLADYKPNDIFSEPIYNDPKNILKIETKNFKNLLSSTTNTSVSARIEGSKILPYFDRKEISVDRVLKNMKLEIAYLEPVDAFFIQIQGSATLKFPDGKKIRVGYANQNGYPYVPIGKFLKDKIPLEKMSMQRIKKYLLGQDKLAVNEILNKNPSYVFFKEIQSEALTYSGVEVSDGRTIATDKEFFPKGALAFFDINEPVFSSSKEIDPETYVRRARLVFDQDTGGAIKGGGRVDLYFGKDADAEQKAGVMKQVGKLYYLIPKDITL